MITQDLGAQRYRHKRPDRRAGQFARREDVAIETIRRDGQLLRRGHPPYGPSGADLKAAVDAMRLHGVPTSARRRPSRAEIRAAKTAVQLFGGRQ